MRNFILPNMSKISAVFSALQMLILHTAELQIRQDEIHPPLGAGSSLRRHPPLGVGSSLRRT
jgi:hypothetical protein